MLGKAAPLTLATQKSLVSHSERQGPPLDFHCSLIHARRPIADIGARKESARVDDLACPAEADDCHTAYQAIGSSTLCAVEHRDAWHSMQSKSKHPQSTTVPDQVRFRIRREGRMHLHYQRRRHWQLGRRRRCREQCLMCPRNLSPPQRLLSLRGSRYSGGLWSHM